ncbi:MAG: ribonucleotide-diphosphate reductase subunit alpha [Deltaproteobacteria bacterium]|nr:MAG: ribonucleotide-diphosphate reductase subunit alpha [Deltaproteobacteria bacterium]
MHRILMKPDLSDNARTILEKRYLKKDADGQVIESPADMFSRVARTVAVADQRFDPKADIKQTTETFRQVMADLWFIPNSPTLMNAGRPLGQLAACFVLPIEDSMESIFDTLKHTALIHKSGGGTGFSFSSIRPAGDTVRSTSGVSSGPLPFLEVFDSMTEAVKQGGTRNGANMAVLRVDHPDIDAFIRIKSDPGRLTNFNLSVALTDRFMSALSAGESYDLINPRTGNPVGQIPARHVFDQIVESAWQSGEPGILFIDRINRANPTPDVGRIDATNPCGEQPLLPFESCTLGSINLAAMVDDDQIHWDRLKQTVHTAVHFLDNVVEINHYPLPEIETASRATRKIGLGVMGFADMLIKRNIPYNSDDAVAEAEQVMAFIRTHAHRASARLAKHRGKFLFFEQSVFSEADGDGMRNATTTTIAPTGTISLIAGVSSGVEPLFAIAHKRRAIDGQPLVEIHPHFIATARKEGFYTDQLITGISRTGSIQEIDTIPEAIRRVYVTAHDIAPEWHVRIQAAFQKHTDNAVSKTVNFPAAATRDQIGDVFKQAYDLGCKGVTVYRYGSREKQVLFVNDQLAVSGSRTPRPRPEQTTGLTRRISTGCGNLYVTVNSDDMGLCEVFAKMGKTGGCASSQIEAAGRLVSLALRSGIRVDSVIKQLKGIRCPSPIWQNGKMILSCPDAMAKVLEVVSGVTPGPSEGMQGVCPECGDVLTHEEGCLVCHGCGFSKCS